jgi:hypothetical protein
LCFGWPSFSLHVVTPLLPVGSFGSFGLMVPHHAPTSQLHYKIKWPFYITLLIQNEMAILHITLQNEMAILRYITK